MPPKNQSRELLHFLEYLGVGRTFLPAAIVVQNGQILLSFFRFGQTILFAYNSSAESLTLVGEN